MKSLKEKLLSSLGIFGLILYYLISISVLVVPVVAIHIPGWAQLLVLLATLFVPVLDLIGTPIVWIWSYICMWREPTSWFTYVYIGFAALSAVSVLVNTACADDDTAKWLPVSVSVSYLVALAVLFFASF